MDLRRQASGGSSHHSRTNRRSPACYSSIRSFATMTRPLKSLRAASIHIGSVTYDSKAVSEEMARREEDSAFVLRHKSPISRRTPLQLPLVLLIVEVPF